MSHHRWAADIEETQGHRVTFPLIGDADLRIAARYDMIQRTTRRAGRTKADNATVRSVFLIGPDKEVTAMLIYPPSIGRNFDEARTPPSGSSGAAR